MPATNLGKVSVQPRGEWDATTAYYKLNVVSHSGGSYLAKQDVPAGTLLTNNEYWMPIAAPAEAVREWLDEHPEATTTVQDHSLGYIKFMLGTLGFVTPEMYGAVGDGTTDDSAAWQDAVNSGCAAIVCLPGRTYNISNVTLRSHLTIFFGDASIVTPAAINWIFTAEDAEDLAFNGGVFERPGTELVDPYEDSPGNTQYRTGTSGVFKLVNCQNIRFSGIRFDETWTHNNIRCVSCTDVVVQLCKTTAFHSGNFVFYNDCINITVDSCEISNGTYEGLYYIYPIASGFTDYSNPYRGITNFTISNCTISVCDWEGIDSHGGANIRIINNKIVDCGRWITCYGDNRPQVVPGTVWGNILIEGNYCEETGSHEYPSHGYGHEVPLLLHGNFRGRAATKNFIIRNNVFKNPHITEDYGMASVYYIEFLTICGCRFEFLPVQGIQNLFRLNYNTECRIQNNMILNSPATNSIFRCWCSSGFIEQNQVIGDTTATRLISAPVSASGQYYPKVCMDDDKNVGNFTYVREVPGRFLYRQAAFLKNAGGDYTGNVMASYRGFRPSISGFTSYEGTILAEDSHIIAVEHAEDRYIKNEFLRISGSGISTYNALITDIGVYEDSGGNNVSYIRVSGAPSAALSEDTACTIENVVATPTPFGGS